MINSRDLNDLVPSVRALAQKLIDRAAEEGVHLIATSTFRDFAQQRALYAQGRTTPGLPCTHDGKTFPVGKCRKHPLGLTVTGAKPGESWHNWKRAIDVAPIVNGKAVWTDEALWKRIGAWGIECGLEWAGAWKGKRQESPHFQLTEGLAHQALLKEFPNGL